MQFTKIRRESAAETFLKKQTIISLPLFQDPNNGAAFVPESETSPAGLGECPGFLLVGLKMADKKSRRKKFHLFH
jgi:hypothetical protein